MDRSSVRMNRVAGETVVRRSGEKETWVRARERKLRRSPQRAPFRCLRQQRRLSSSLLHTVRTTPCMLAAIRRILCDSGCSPALITSSFSHASRLLLAFAAQPAHSCPLARWLLSRTNAGPAGHGFPLSNPGARPRGPSQVCHRRPLAAQCCGTFRRYGRAMLEA